MFLACDIRMLSNSRVMLNLLKSNRWSTVNCLIGFVGKLAIACLASLSTINLGVAAIRVSSVCSPIIAWSLNRRHRSNIKDTIPSFSVW
jgi:hypothetical protein